MNFTKFHKNHEISHFRVKCVLRPPGLGAPGPWMRISGPRQGSGCGGRQSEWVRLRRAWGPRGRPRSPVAAVGSPTSAMTFSLSFTGSVPESSGAAYASPPSLQYYQAKLPLGFHQRKIIRLHPKGDLPLGRHQKCYFRILVESQLGIWL